MLLLLAVRFEHVNEAMALGVELSAHSKFAMQHKFRSMRFKLDLFSPYLVRSQAPVKGLATVPRHMLLTASNPWRYHASAELMWFVSCSWALA